MAKAIPEHPLRKWRKARGLTLHEAALRIGTVRQVWSDWERGRRRPGPQYMPLVRDLTDGEVTADAFYPSANGAIYERQAA
jgi:transcriptional regulator with XRE-family HTH domain